MRVITCAVLQLCFKVLFCSATAFMAAWGQPGIAGLPAEITEEKLQEKGNIVAVVIFQFVAEFACLNLVTLMEKLS